MPRIEAFYAFISDDGAGHEGLACFYDPRTGGWMPMVAADEAMVDSLRVMAQRVASDSGWPVTLAQFAIRMDVEVIEP